MKKIKILTVSLILAAATSVSAGVIKESQAKREVEDAIQELAKMDGRAELQNFLVGKEPLLARRYCNKARTLLNDSEYDKASYYAVLSVNYSIMSTGKALMGKAEKDKTESELAALKADTSSVAPRLKSAGLKRKGSSPVFAGTFDLKALYDVKSVKASPDSVPAALTADITGKVAEMCIVLNDQKTVKIQINAKGKTEDHAAKYADHLKTAFIEKGIEAARIDVVTKKGKDSVDITLDGVKAK